MHQITSPSDFGLATAQVPSASTGPGSIPSIGRIAGPDSISAAKPWHPDNPLFWFAGLAAATFGLIGFSSQVRVGRWGRASASVGKGKK